MRFVVKHTAGVCEQHAQVCACLCIVLMNMWLFKTLLASGLGTKALAVFRLQITESVLLSHIRLPGVRFTEQCQAHLQQKRLRLRLD